MPNVIDLNYICDGIVICREGPQLITWRLTEVENKALVSHDVVECRIPPELFRQCVIADFCLYLESELARLSVLNGLLII